MVDVQHATAHGDTDEYVPTRLMFLVDASGRLYSQPISTPTSGRVTLGKATRLTAKGLPALRNIDLIARYWDTKKPKYSKAQGLVALTKDGRLLRIDVGHSTKTVRITKVTTLMKGQKSATAVLVGSCDSPAKGSDQFLALVNRNSSVTAILGAKYSMTGIKGTTSVRLKAKIPNPALVY